MNKYKYLNDLINLIENVFKKICKNNKKQKSLIMKVFLVKKTQQIFSKISEMFNFIF
jgi:hypothetical protein